MIVHDSVCTYMLDFGKQNASERSIIVHDGVWHLLDGKGMPPPQGVDERREAKARSEEVKYPPDRHRDGICQIPAQKNTVSTVSVQHTNKPVIGTQNTH